MPPSKRQSRKRFLWVGVICACTLVGFSLLFRDVFVELWAVIRLRSSDHEEVIAACRRLQRIGSCRSIPTLLSRAVELSGDRSIVAAIMTSTGQGPHIPRSTQEVSHVRMLLPLYEAIRSISLRNPATAQGFLKNWMDHENPWVRSCALHVLHSVEVVIHERRQPHHTARS